MLKLNILLNKLTLLNKKSVYLKTAKSPILNTIPKINIDLFLSYSPPHR